MFTSWNIALQCIEEAKFLIERLYGGKTVKSHYQGSGHVKKAIRPLILNAEHDYNHMSDPCHD